MGGAGTRSGFCKVYLPDAGLPVWSVCPSVRSAVCLFGGLHASATTSRPPARLGVPLWPVFWDWGLVFRLAGEGAFRPAARSAFVELGVASAFSFLRAASDAVDLTETANRLGYDAIGIADHNTLAGVVRVHVEARTACVRPVIGARLVLLCGGRRRARPI